MEYKEEYENEENSEECTGRRKVGKDRGRKVQWGRVKGGAVQVRGED